MGLFDFLKVNDFKAEIETLKKENTSLRGDIESLNNLKLSVEQQSAIELQNTILKLKKEKDTIEETISTLGLKNKDLDAQVSMLNKQIIDKEKLLVNLDDDLLVQEFGLYRPKYDFASSLNYKDALRDIRSQQKQMIKEKTALSCSIDWTVEGSKSKGRKMLNDAIKQALLCFNNECEAAINKVKYNNIESIEKRIYKSAETVNKLNKVMNISINENFINLKIQELHLAYEYELKKEEEREELREQRQKEREEKALRKEIESKKKKLDKEVNHLKNAIDELKEKLASASEEEAVDIEKSISELENNVTSYENEKVDLDYRIENVGAGYVYIISNIGSFGEDVFKIGVTRRLDPLDRIKELSSASVPFKFDVHALVFSYKAYELESELHKIFEENKVNMVNSRKEFFKISIDEIEQVLNKYKDLTIDFSRTPEAQEYRESLSMKNL